MNINMENKIKKLCYINKNIIIPTFFITFSILLKINPFKNLEVSSFDRQIGVGLLANIDVSKRINNMIKFNFILLPIMLIVIYFILKIIFLCINRKYNKSNYECIEFINKISIIGFVPLIFAYINIFSGNNLLLLGVIIPILIIMLCIMFLVLSIFNFKLKFRVFKWTLFATLPITFLLGIFYFELKGSLTLKILILIYIIASIIINILYMLANKFLNFNLISRVYTLIMISPIIVIISNEICNILTQYNILVNSKIKLTCMIYLVLLIISLILCFIYKEKWYCYFNFEKFYYPIIILGLSLILTELPYQIIANTELFEQANHGVAINEFLKNWSIPIIENLDSHMLQNEIGAIVFGIFNNDSIGAMFMGYKLDPIIILTYYLMFSKFFDRDYALLITLLCPIQAEKTFYVFPLAPFVILSFLYAFNKKNYRGYIVFWVSIAIASLYRLDMGFALAMASIITWIIMFILDKNKVCIKKVILSCIYVVCTCLFIFISICLVKKIDPINRVLEILRVVLSNINWGYDKIGSELEMSFIIHYFIIPISVISTIIILLYKKYTEKDFIENKNTIIVLILGFIFIFNYSRGILRHSLYEGLNEFILSTYVIFISLAISLIKNKNKILIFVSTFLFAFIITCLSINNDIIDIKPLLVSSIDKYTKFDLYKSEYKKNEKRVIISEEMKSIYEPLKNVLDNILADDESYIDFTNQTLLYPLINRKNPVYINQSPGLLSGEELQKQFIDECEGISNKLPLVLMPLNYGVACQSLDGILNSYRYYLVTEYICTNYQPLFKNDMFAIWVKKDKFNEFYSKVSNYIDSDKKYSNQIKFIDYDYLELIYHSHNLANLPYIWANYDKNPISEKEIQLEIGKNNLNGIIYGLSSVDKSNGNYLKMNISSNEEQSLTIKFGKNTINEFKTLNEFTMTIKSGEKLDYLIRISGDFMWYSNEINSIKIENTKDQIIINDISILKGDTLK